MIFNNYSLFRYLQHFRARFILLNFTFVLFARFLHLGVGTVDTNPKTWGQKLLAKLGALNEAIDQHRADAAMKNKIDRATLLMNNYQSYV
jgi:hypothetical protein